MRISTPVVESLFDYTFSRDEYNLQQILAGKDAKVHAFVTLLFMEPGTIADNPLMGVNLVSYRHSIASPAEVSTLSAHIKSQVETYMGKMITDVNVVIDPDNDGIIDISVTIEKELIILKLDMDNPKVQVIYINKNFNG